MDTARAGYKHQFTAEFDQDAIVTVFSSKMLGWAVVAIRQYESKQDVLRDIAANTKRKQQGTRGGPSVRSSPRPFMITGASSLISGQNNLAGGG